MGQSQGYTHTHTHTHTHRHTHTGIKRKWVSSGFTMSWYLRLGMTMATCPVSECVGVFVRFAHADMGTERASTFEGEIRNQERDKRKGNMERDKERGGGGRKRERKGQGGR